MEEVKRKFTLAERVRGRYQRMTARHRAQRKVAIELKHPIISFTFDDFPRSALFAGGGILKKYGLAGTYYTSFGLMGTVAPTGEAFVREDLDVLLQDGHELGCHTWEHSHPWETSATEWEASIRKNREALAEMFPEYRMRSMSYPLSVPTAANKRIAGRWFDCCRGRGEHSNVGVADLNFLSSHFLERKLGGPDPALRAIEENKRDCGWLIFSTHDICDQPTPYGWTPKLFEMVVRASVNSGAIILPVIGAWDRIAATLPQKT